MFEYSANKVITGIEIDANDMALFNLAANALRIILNRHLAPEWTFKDKQEPVIEFEGVRFLYKPTHLEPF